MRILTSTIMLAALVVALSVRSAGQSAPQPAPVKPDAMTVSELEKAGDLARAEKDYDHAITYFQTAVSKDKKNAVLYNKLGLSYLKQGNLPEARSNFEKAAKRNKKYADALNNVGAVYYVQKNFGSAARSFKKALALDETRPVFHVNLGAAWFSQNKIDRAILEYSRALQLDPGALNQNSRGGVTAQISSPEERARYNYMLAKIYARLGDAEQCLHCLKKAKEDGYRNIANVYIDEEFSRLRQDPRLSEIIPPPVPK
jgi:tetratricopeptide (TPR) repeat protein